MAKMLRTGAQQRHSIANADGMKAVGKIVGLSAKKNAAPASSLSSVVENLKQSVGTKTAPKAPSTKSAAPIGRSNK